MMKPSQSSRQKVQVWIFCRCPGRDTQFLLLRTNSRRGGFWQPVTGSVDPGEPVTSAALREAQEETGLGRPEDLLDLNRQFSFEARGELVTEYGFALEALCMSGAAPEVKLDPHEHDTYRWGSAHEALKEVKFESNKEMLKELLRRLSA